MPVYSDKFADLLYEKKETEKETKKETENRLLLCLLC